MYLKELIIFALALRNKCGIRRKVRFGDIAQSVEQWTENPCVAGSIPAITTE